MAAEIPAGWYPNPWNDAEELYWSGIEWTGISRAVHRAPATGGISAAASEIEDSTIMRPVGPPFEAQDVSPQSATAVTPIADTASFPGAAPSPQPEPFPTSAAPTFQPEPYVAPVAPAAPVFQPQPYAPLPPAPIGGPTAEGVLPADAADAASLRWSFGSAAAPTPVNPRAKFGLIAMILGIVAAAFAVIPGVSFAAWIPAFVAIALGIIGYLGGKPRAFALTGIITGGAALAVGTGVSIWLLIQLGALGR